MPPSLRLRQGFGGQGLRRALPLAIIILPLRGVDGWLKALEESVENNFGVQLIPEKTQSFHIQPDDCLIVLSEDES